LFRKCQKKGGRSTNKSAASQRGAWSHAGADSLSIQSKSIDRKEQLEAAVLTRTQTILRLFEESTFRKEVGPQHQMKKIAKGLSKHNQSICCFTVAFS
jgi:hypothetical protein